MVPFSKISTRPFHIFSQNRKNRAYGKAGIQNLEPEPETETETEPEPEPEPKPEPEPEPKK